MNLRHLLGILAFGGLAWGVRADDPDLRQEVAAANALVAAQRGAEARAAWGRILARHPDNPDADCSLGLYACDDGEWEKALAYEGKALAADPNNARYQYGWGAANGVSALKAGIFSKMGYAKKCLAAYRRASELAPENLQYHWALLSFYQQAPGFAGGDLELAYVQAADIAKIDTEAGREAFGQLYVKEKKYDLAFRQYDEAIRAAPNDYAALYNFGRLTLNTSLRLDEGLAAFRRCLEPNAPQAKNAATRANVHWRLGSVLERQNRAEEARREYLAALQEQPNYRQAKQALEKLGPPKT